MDSDERFKHLATDPRFRPLRNKQKKVQIDDRFKSMFTDEKFTLKYVRDKRGRNQKKNSGDDLKKFYSLADDNKEEDKHDDKKDKKDVDERDDKIDEDDVVDEDEIDEDAVDENEEEQESESEVSSSSDEAESDDDVAEGDDVDYIDVKGIQFDWQPLDHDAETAETTTKRLAIQNLDWDHLDIQDIYALVHSVRPPVNVRIYISEFGKERLKQEELEGPKEIVEMPKVDEIEEEYNQLKEKMDALKDPRVRKAKSNNYEDADEELDPKNQEIRERIRTYQLNKMKYYYAVVEFDSVESAEAVYKELDGMEYEGSSLELDLRFIPDDIEFDPEDIKSECDTPPDLTTYKAPLFINSALQQTNVKFTWDETDIKRQEKLKRSYTKEELEKDDLDAYLASETESDEDEDGEEKSGSDNDDVGSIVTANSEARVNKYKMLLKSLDEEAEKKKKKVDVDVEWGNYSEDEVGEEAAAADRKECGNVDSSSDNLDDDGEESGSSIAEDWSEERKRTSKELRKSKKSKGGRRQVNGDRNDIGETRELDLLVMDMNASEEEFRFDPDDDRFKAVYESGLYNIDPSHPNFKRTQAFDIMAERKRTKRQRTSNL